MVKPKEHRMRCIRCGKPLPTSGGLAELCSRCLKEKANQLRRNERLTPIEQERMDFLRKVLGK